MATASRAVLITDLSPDGDLQHLDWKLVEKEKPRASPGHVVVHITLRPVNPSDLQSPKLVMSHLEHGKSIVTGNEGVGYVEEVGEGVTKVTVGQRVVPSFLHQFYVHGNGSWQEYVKVKEVELFLVPDSIPDEIAAQSLINPWALFGLMKEQALPKGEYLLNNGANSVLGRQVVQLAKHWGIKTINIVRRDDVKEELKSLGADEVINSTTEEMGELYLSLEMQSQENVHVHSLSKELIFSSKRHMLSSDLVKRVKEITGGKGAYGALDPVAGTQTQKIVASVRDRGKVFVYGAMGTRDDYDCTVNIFDLGRVRMKWWGLNTIVDGCSIQQLQEMSTEVWKLLEDKVIVPLTGKTFKLEDFKEAILEADKPGRGGKVLLAS